MKKMLIGILAVSVALTACKSQQPAEAQFQHAYDRHYGDLILDGAGTYTVVEGDTLAGIARTNAYNDGFYYPVIMLASKDIVTDPDLIEPGMVLIVPVLQKNLEDAKARASIKSYLLEIAKIEDSRSRPYTAEGLRNLSKSM